MDQQIIDIANNVATYAILGGMGVAASYLITKYWIKSKEIEKRAEVEEIKSRLETYPDKITADIEYAKQMQESKQKILELMQNDEYRKYVERRISLAKELIKNEENTKGIFSICLSSSNHLEQTLDAILGSNPIEN